MGSDLFRFELLSEHEPCWGEVSGSHRQPLQQDGRAVAALYERRKLEDDIHGSWEATCSVLNCSVNMNLAGVKSAAVADSRYSGMDVL